MLILMGGLEGAGKTTILYKAGQNVTESSSSEWSMGIVHYKNITINVWDVGVCHDKDALEFFLHLIDQVERALLRKLFTIKETLSI
nr:60S ribosomal protein L19-1-like [Tanacetum cinerariifolium]